MITHVTKRNGTAVPFNSMNILTAVERAFQAEYGEDYGVAEEQRARVIAESVTASFDKYPSHIVPVESIQDAVELHLNRKEEYNVVRKFILYREAQNSARKDAISFIHEDGRTIIVTPKDLEDRIADAVPREDPHFSNIVTEVRSQLRSNTPITDLDRAITFTLRTYIERDPSFMYYSADSLLRSIYIEVANVGSIRDMSQKTYGDTFKKRLQEGVNAGILDSRLLEFDLDFIAASLKPKRDRNFKYLGLQTVYDRYLIKIDRKRVELPQALWMRVAMGLALNEKEKEGRAIEFYNVLSNMDIVSSTPTLFNSGTTHPQMSSCYLTTTQDDLGSIFKTFADHAQLSKWSGGIGADWTNVRSLGAEIKGTNGQGQGLIPFLKIENDTAIAVNQGGKRKGAIAAYLETWHADIEEFLDLRKNAGDDRRRTHDMNTANWIPDLFMERVMEDGDWWLFNPSDVPDLHHIYGEEFRRAYTNYERLASTGIFPLARKVKAVDLWRKMLSALFETAHPWITFKDTNNIRSPQRHVGVIHNSNLCTEISLNTSEDETAVCNLASINLSNYVDSYDGKINFEKMYHDIQTAVRMLDNVIDINYYPTKEAETANKRHRPIGLGIMGFQDALWKADIPYASVEAVEFADGLMEHVSLYAIQASSKLAFERGSYETFEGSDWSKGIVPYDTMARVAATRKEGHYQADKSMNLGTNWSLMREEVQNGMRNSLVMAIAPTATIANIAGVTQSIEPMFSNIFVKSNLSGEFTVVNEYLVQDLLTIGLWDDIMLEKIKYHDGSIALIEEIPLEIRLKYPTAFEVEPQWLIEAASRRQKWIDQGQSLNLYLSAPSGKKLDEMYKLTWTMGLKTNYYLRTTSATQVEKSTVDVNKFGIQPKWMKHSSASADVQINRGIGDALRTTGVHQGMMLINEGFDPSKEKVTLPDGTPLGQALREGRVEIGALPMAHSVTVGTYKSATEVVNMYDDEQFEICESCQ